MRIDFYYTAKRINSLVRPDVDESQTIITTFTDFNLKDETDLNNPVFMVVASNLPETNYCILSNTGATAERPDKYYYFVDRIEQVRKTVWNIHCTIDALATWKTQILQQSAFVERSTNLYNPYVTDSLLPTKNELSQRTIYAKINADLQPALRGGIYILSLGSSGAENGGVGVPVGNTTGGTAVYALTAANCASLLQTLFSSGVAAQAKQAFASVSDCILGLHWLPIGMYAIGGIAVDKIFVANTSVSVNALRLDRNIYDTGQILSENVTLTHYGDYRDIAPFRSYYAKVPYGGMFDLDTDIIAWRNRLNGGSVSFNTRQMLDFYTGVIQQTIYCDNFEVGRVEGCAKVDIPVSTYHGNISSMAGAALDKYGETVNSIFDFFGIGKKGVDGWSGSFMDGVADWLKSGGSYSQIGGFGGSNIGAYDPEIRVVEKIQDTSVPPSNVAGVAGRPYCGVVALNSLNGYCKTQGFTVRGRMTADEKRQIEDAFNISGVFITE